MNILGLILPFNYSAYFLKLVVDGQKDGQTDMTTYTDAIPVE